MAIDAYLQIDGIKGATEGGAQQKINMLRLRTHQNEFYLALREKGRSSPIRQDA